MAPIITALDKSTIYDFTSDTATVPTEEMFDLMKTATRGDDVFQLDDDCKTLEDHVAQLLGHEAGLFCATGTLSNQLGLRCLLFQPPHSVLCDSRSHVYNYECGGIAYHSQASVTPVVAKGTYMTAQEVEKQISKDTLCGAPTKVISLENTMNGVIMPLEEIQQIHQVARVNDCKMHLDGARLWNASQKTGTALSEYGRYFDTISVCLSKGVGAPIGSILVGSKELIGRARHLRKLMGGGWRQAGMLARSAYYCLQTVLPTMPQTHALTRHLADSLQELGFTILLPVETNMIFIDIAPAGITLSELAQRLLERNIKIFTGPGTTTRIVLHYQINALAVKDFIQISTDLVHEKKQSGFLRVEPVEQAELVYPSVKV
ncbi:hypothetical protein G6F56_005264 [Rhizopus delemar]|nr:hypothetical protein G6F56_005264 [Rhizopus delemar]